MSKQIKANCHVNPYGWMLHFWRIKVNKKKLGCFLLRSVYMTFCCPLLPYETYHFALVPAYVAIPSQKDSFWEQKPYHYRVRNIIKCYKDLGVKKSTFLQILSSNPETFGQFFFLTWETHFCANDLCTTWSGWMGLKQYVWF